MLLFMENENYALVDALPYIDTQLGSVEVAQQVKALIEEEMALFEPRDYLKSLPAPELSLLNNEPIAKELARVEAGQSMEGVDIGRYKVEHPQGATAQDHGAWTKLSQSAQMQLEYNRLRVTNLEMLERWGGKAWIAHSAVVRNVERCLTAEVSALRAQREDVNKKRKLDQVSCGNELRKLTREMEQYTHDNAEVESGLVELEEEVHRLKRFARERGIDINGTDPNEERRPAEDDAEA